MTPRTYLVLQLVLLTFALVVARWLLVQPILDKLQTVINAIRVY